MRSGTWHKGPEGWHRTKADAERAKREAAPLTDADALLALARRLHRDLCHAIDMLPRDGGLSAPCDAGIVKMFEARRDEFRKYLGDTSAYRLALHGTINRLTSLLELGLRSDPRAPDFLKDEWRRDVASELGLEFESTESGENG